MSYTESQTAVTYGRHTGAVPTPHTLVGSDRPVWQAGIASPPTGIICIASAKTHPYLLTRSAKP
jgi:hypothetical protein